MKSYFSVWGVTSFKAVVVCFLGAMAEKRSAMRLFVGELSKDLISHPLIHFM